MAVVNSAARFVAAILVAGVASGSAAAQSANGATPTGTDVSIRNIDNAINAFAAVKGNKNAAQTALVLSVIKGVGKKSASDGSRLDYHIDVAPDGGVSINGLDLAPVMQMAGAKAKG